MLWNWFGFGRGGVPRDRALFTYRDGRRIRRADPVAIEDVLIRHLGHDWHTAPDKLRAPLPLGVVGVAADEERNKRAELRRKITAAVCAAFDVKEAGLDADAGGLTVIELFGLLDGYSRFAAALLELSRPFVNAQPRASPSPEPPPAPSGADSTLAGTESPAPAPAI